MTGSDVLNVQIHGDAAFAGQGVVYEALTLTNLADYNVNGSVHIICNNFIGFTTLPSLGGRSTRHSGDICKAFGIPIIHVNGAEGGLHLAARMGALAVRYR